jgi:hypothetical protein
MTLQFSADDLIGLSTVPSKANDIITACALFEYGTI